jgi:hypothetical protein
LKMLPGTGYRFDLDSIACPVWLDPVHEPDRTVEHVVALLSDEFHGATCWWQFTSGQGVKDGIRIRLFFWSVRALADWELKAWLGERVPIAGMPRCAWPPRFPVDLWIIRAGAADLRRAPDLCRYAGPGALPLGGVARRPRRDHATRDPEAEWRRHSDDRESRRRAGQWLRVPSVPDRRPRQRRRLLRSDQEHSWVMDRAARRIGRHRMAPRRLERAIREASRDPAKHPDDYIDLRVRDLDPLIASILALEAAAEASDC